MYLVTIAQIFSLVETFEFGEFKVFRSFRNIFKSTAVSKLHNGNNNLILFMVKQVKSVVTSGAVETGSFNILKLF